MAVLSIFVRFLALSVAVEAIALQRQGTIATDLIVGLPEAVPSGIEADVYEAYQPYLDVINGCIPYPAVDVNGNTNTGLPLTGSQNSGCSGSLGQIYARVAEYNNMYGVMYSWYMPKDELSAGLGHRHDWEGVIIWLSSGTNASEDNMLAVCPSAHGGWIAARFGSVPAPALGSHIFSIWPIDDQCGLSTEIDGHQPLIAWESLPDAAREALETTDFGSATPPFRTANFTENLAAARF